MTPSLLVAQLGTVQVSLAAGSTLYVDQKNPTCSDKGPGTQSQPFCTISKGAAVAVAGQTVTVNSGSYSEKVQVLHSGVASSPVTVAAASGALVTVTGGLHGFAIANQSYVVIQGFTVTGTTAQGIYVTGSTNITIAGNHVSNAGKPALGLTAKGIYLGSTTNSLVIGNTTDHNSDSGIYLTSGTTGTEVKNNLSFKNAEVFRSGAAGIELSNCTANTVDGNVLHDNEDSGISDSNASSMVFFNNASFNNQGHGIDVLNSSGARIISNSIYSNAATGINLEGTSSGGTLANNITVDNALMNATQGEIRVDAKSVVGTVIDYDLLFYHSASRLIQWNGFGYTSLAKFKAATGQEGHGIQADPMWSSPSTADFHLLEGSPAIDSANSGVSGESATDADGNPRVDDPATPNTGAGPRPYDDRGAYEFQPPSSGAPNAVLSVTPSSGTVPFAVTADGSNSTDPDSTPIATFKFDFGDGTVMGPQAGATATHAYTVGGKYTVTMMVTDTGGLASTATASVAAEGPPIASLTVTPTSGIAPLTVLADASGTADKDSTPIATYKFDFGDTTVIGPQAGATANHTFAGPGTYTVTVTVADTAGLLGTKSVTVTVTPSDFPPVPALAVTPTSGSAPLNVTADASGSTDTDVTPIASYTFDFGDGTAAIGPQALAKAAHTFMGAGTFAVKVTVTDTVNLSSSKTVTVTVLDTPPAAALTVTPTSGPVPLTVTADASGSTDPDSTPISTYRFDFGDGTAVVGPQPGATATHTYQGSGTFTVTLTVTDTASLSSSKTATVAVGDLPPVANLTVTPSSGAAPLPVTADASGSTDADSTPIATYTFDFGDGTAVIGPQAGATATHTYLAAGSFTATVTVRDTAGLSSTASTRVHLNLVGNPGFEVSTTGWDTAGVAGVTLSRVSGGHSGGWSAQLTNNGSGPQSCVLNDSPNWIKKTSAGTYTGSIWVRADTAGATIKLKFREYNGTALVGFAMVSATLTTSWQQLTVTYTPIAPGSSTLDFQTYISSAAVGTCFFGDDAAIMIS